MTVPALKISENEILVDSRDIMNQIDTKFKSMSGIDLIPKIYEKEIIDFVERIYNFPIEIITFHSIMS